MLNDGEVSELLVRVGGSGVRNACDIYVEKNGPLNVGEVVSLSPAKLKCYHLHLYHSALSNSDLINISTIRKIFSFTLVKADNSKCKSISIPALKLKQVIVNHILIAIKYIVLISELNHLQIIRIVEDQKTTLKLFQKAFKHLH